jgi:hypothetical protein
MLEDEKNLTLMEGEGGVAVTKKKERAIGEPDGGDGEDGSGEGSEYSTSEDEGEHDEEDKAVPKEFIDSVATQRDRLLKSYRNYRK